MIAVAAEQTLIPPAAGFDVGNGNQRLRAHVGSVSSRVSALRVEKTFPIASIPSEQNTNRFPLMALKHSQANAIAIARRSY